MKKTMFLLTVFLLGGCASHNTKAIAKWQRDLSTEVQVSTINQGTKVNVYISNPKQLPLSVYDGAKKVYETKKKKEDSKHEKHHYNDLY